MDEHPRFEFGHGNIDMEDTIIHKNVRTAENVELRQVDTVYMLDDDEGPPITQASQITAREFVHPTDQELGSASTMAGFDEYAEKNAGVQDLERECLRSENMIRATEKDEHYRSEVEATAQKEIDALYEKNMAALDANLAHKKATKGKENMVEEFVAPKIDKWKGIISAEAGLDLKDNENDGEGSRKRKTVNSEWSDDEEDDDDYEYEYDESSVSSDDGDGEDRLVDTDFELEDDTELADLLAERKKQWSHISEFMEGEAGSLTVQKDDEDSDSEWLEPGDDVESDDLHSYSSSDSDGPCIGNSRLR